MAISTVNRVTIVNFEMDEISLRRGKLIGMFAC
jgi:hypothetical protein